MRRPASLAVYALVLMLSTHVCAENVSEDRARDAISAYKAKNFQSACNKLADLNERQDPVSTYFLGYDIIFGDGMCLPITKELAMYKKFWLGIVDEHRLKDKIGRPNSSLLEHYITGGAAAKMIEVAANAGYMPAQTRLGQLYMQFEVDTYLPRDFGLAQNWLQKASASGGGLAEYLLGVLSQNGAGQGTASEHYIKAADRGHLYAMQITAQGMYDGSDGFPKNKDKARIYLNNLLNQNEDIKKRHWANKFMQNFYYDNVYRQ